MSTTEEATKKLDGEAVAAVPVATATAAAEEGTVTASTTTDSNGNEETKTINGESEDGTSKVVAEGSSETKPKVETNNDIANPNNIIDRGNLDHTSRKVVVHNVLKYVRAKEVVKLTTKWLLGHESKFQIVKTKKPPKDNWVKVTLADESMVNPFIELINKGGENGEAMVNAKGKPLFAKRADEMFNNDKRDGLGDSNGKRKADGDDNGRDGKRMRTSDPNRVIRILSKDEVRDKITPGWRMPYEEQLNEKAKEMVNKCAKKIVKEIKGRFRTLEREYKRNQRKDTLKIYEWVDTKRAIEMEQPVPSPESYEYRNKCEFTFGYRLEEVKEEGKDGDAVMKVEEVVKVEEVAQEVEVKVTETKADADVKVEDVKVEETTAESKADDTTVKDEEMKEAQVKVEEPTTPAPTPTYKKIPAVGFLAQGWAGGVYSPHCLQNMPDWSCGLADIFNDEFLPTSSVPPYDSKSHRGVWRTVTIRCSLRTRECMVIVLHAPAKGGAGALEDGSDAIDPEVFEGEKKRLVELLTKGVIPTPKRDDYPEDHKDEKKKGRNEEEKGEGMKVTSIFFQEFDGLSNPKPDHPVQHAFGKTSLEEKLGKCTFQISPGAFFQTNTKGAEVLYNIVVSRIKEVATDPTQTLLLDVCCGTGTIGLTCLKEGVVGKMVGVDISEPAIEDAKINAKKNGYNKDDPTTCRFIASAAEKILPDTMKDIKSSKPIVAVVDPARDGLHPVVIRTLRANEGIQRLVYVSCNPTATLVRDAAMLCSPPTKKYPGRPFKPTLSQPVDMFPLTKHCEMVMTFDRMSEEEYEKYHGTTDSKV